VGLDKMQLLAVQSRRLYYDLRLAVGVLIAILRDIGTKEHVCCELNKAEESRDEEQDLHRRAQPLCV
jgi:hypothetical protein